MKKIILVLAISLIAFAFTVYSCRENKDDFTNTTNSVISNSSIANRGSIQPFTTIGGSLQLNSTSIENLYSLIGENNISNLRNIVLYSNGTQTSTIDVEKVSGLSVFHYDGAKLQHSFYIKNPNGTFSNLPELTLNCFGVTIAETEFAAFFSGIYKDNHLTVYSIKNNAVYQTKLLRDPNNNSTDYISSYDMFDFRAALIGNLISLENPPESGVEAEALNQMYARVSCRKCQQPDSTGDCEVDLSVNNCSKREIDTETGTGFEPNDPPLCPEGKAESKVAILFKEYFNEDIMYAIRDNVLVNSTVGMKYYNYYYQTSFYNVNYNITDAQKIAVLLPKIYNLYENYTENNLGEDIFDESTRDDIVDLLETLKTKNSNRENLVKIFDDVKKDVIFLSTKKIGDVPTIIY